MIWGRSIQQSATVGILAKGASKYYSVGAARAEPSITHAVRGADLVICTVPAHVRHCLLKRIRKQLDACVLLLMWEGMGRFMESLHELGIRPQIAAGLQRSPLLCRIIKPFRSVEIFGVRSQVVAAPADPDSLGRIQGIASEVLPFQLTFVPDYNYVAFSPSNPLIHPARIYSRALHGAFVPREALYGDWDDHASTILLSLHSELALLRGSLGLSPLWLPTLIDRSTRPSPAQITHETRSAGALRSIAFPVRETAYGVRLDWAHRFFQEDIGEGLMHIRRAARACCLRLAVTEEICRWYGSARNTDT